MNIEQWKKRITGGGREFQKLRFNLYGQGIKTSYEPYEHEPHKYQEDDPDTVFGGKESRRMIFTITGRNGSKFPNSDGLILDRNGWKYVVVPPPYYERNYTADIVNYHLSERMYDIIPLTDGTLMHLYYWNHEKGDEWRISTNSGYDVTDYPCLYLQKTFKQIFEEAAECSIDEMNLNREFSYSFVVTHCDIHWYWKSREPHKQIMLVHKANRDTGEISYECEYKCPVQTPIAKDTKNMVIRNFHSDEFPMGVLLRSRDPAITKHMSYVMIEGALYKEIKSLIYSVQKNIPADLNQENAIVLYSYLNTDTQYAFRKAFPQYEELCEMMHTKITDLIRAVCDLYNSRQADSQLVDNSQLVEKSDNSQVDNSQLVDSQVTKYAAIIKSYIDNLTTIKPDEFSQKIITCYVMDKDMLKVLYPYIFN